LPANSRCKTEKAASDEENLSSYDLDDTPTACAEINQRRRRFNVAAFVNLSQEDEEVLKLILLLSPFFHQPAEPESKKMNYYPNFNLPPSSVFERKKTQFREARQRNKCIRIEPDATQTRFKYILDGIHNSEHETILLLTN
jgi:hypothetical protein